ncbi:MAG TPA: hypothetical protein VF403_01545, partial [Kofleriaceae bacterium]
MLDRIRQKLRRAKWHASDLAWFANWRAIRAATTPLARPIYEAACAKVTANRTTAVISREALDGWLEHAAPPDVPFEAVVLPTSALKNRFGAEPLERRSLHLNGKL